MVFAETGGRVVQMREDAVFASEDSIVPSHCSNMVNVAVDSCASRQVIDLRDASLALEALFPLLSEGHRWSELVFFMVDNVMANTVKVIGSCDFRCLGRPRVRRLIVLGVLSLANHSVEQVLERPFLCRWL